MNPHMSVEIVKEMEQGKELTEAQNNSIQLAQEKELLEPGE
jgi:hypothetical protein